MKSPEGELVPWSRKCDVTTPENNGNVEKWLLELEEIVFDTLRDRINESNAAYARQARGEWCQEWPGQVVLATDMIYWTTETKVPSSSFTALLEFRSGHRGIDSFTDALRRLLFLPSSQGTLRSLYRKFTT